MPILDVKNLKTYFFTNYGVVKAVDGVNFHVNEGETLGLVGESGSGKSVCGQSILRVVPKPAGKIVEGQVIFNEEDLLLKSEKEMRSYRGRHLTMILQDPMRSLNPVFKIGYQIAEGIILHQKIKRGPRLWKRVIDVMRLVRIPAANTRLSDYPHQFSGGMRQRVVGAVSLACHPIFLIADEPTTSLDVTTQTVYLNILKDIQQEHKLTMLFITHDFGIVAKMCNKVGVMYSGKIIEMAEVREIFNHPTHPYTKALMQSVPKVEERTDRLFSIDGQPPTPINLPERCAFLPRCIENIDRCQYEEFPPETDLNHGHMVRCWRYV